MNRYTRVSGCLSSPKSCSWLGAASHPRGNASPNSNRWIGISIADTTPPALKSIHKNGSFDLLCILPSQKDPSYGGGYKHPGDVVRCRDGQARKALPAQPDDHRFRGQIKPSHRVEDDESKAHRVQHQKKWTPQRVL